MPTFDDGQNQWRGEIAVPPGHQGCEPPDGGLVLQNVTHQQYNFAKDVRTIGFWITYDKIEKTGTTQERRFYLLERASFEFKCIEKLAASELYLKRKDFKQPADSREYFLFTLSAFPHYPFIYAIRAVYTSKDGFFPANCDMRSLTINQSYLFTAYGSVPAHEPTGGLSAARFMPQINTQFLRNPSHDKTQYPQFQVKAIRFDTRIHLALDTFVDTPNVPASASSAAPQNFAGTFRDREAIATLPGRAAQTIFEAVEKPLVLEMAAKGYVHSDSQLSKDVKAWDNIHWWGARWESKGGAPKLLHISAPGAFFATHFHWRWGGAARDTHILLPNNKGLGDPQFAGTKSNGLLVDPAVFDQDLQFAVVKYDRNTDPAKLAVSDLRKLSKEHFLSFFSGASKPAKIGGGADLVLWLGATFNRTRSDELLNGTQLVHGFFFGHNPEPGFFSKAGSTSAAYFPTEESAILAAQAWERY